MEWNYTKEESLGTHSIHIDNGGIDIEVINQTLVVKDEPEQGGCQLGAKIIISNSFYGYAEGMPFQKEELIKLSDFLKKMAEKL